MRFAISVCISLIIVWFMLDVLESFVRVPGIVAFTLGFFVGKIVNENLLPWMGFEEEEL